MIKLFYYTDYFHYGRVRLGYSNPPRHAPVLAQKHARLSRSRWSPINPMGRVVGSPRAAAHPTTLSYYTRVL